MSPLINLQSLPTESTKEQKGLSYRSAPIFLSIGICQQLRAQQHYFVIGHFQGDQAQSDLLLLSFWARSQWNFETSSIRPTRSSMQHLNFATFRRAFVQITAEINFTLKILFTLVSS